jgi:hypothetical protein
MAAVCLSLAALYDALIATRLLFRMRNRFQFRRSLIIDSLSSIKLLFALPINDDGAGLFASTFAHVFVCLTTLRFFKYILTKMYCLRFGSHQVHGSEAKFAKELLFSFC